MAFKNVSFHFCLLILFSLIATMQSKAMSSIEITTSPEVKMQSSTIELNTQAHQTPPAAEEVFRGKFVLLQNSVGISAMHMQLLYDNTVIIYDRTDFGLSNLSLPAGVCSSDLGIKVDCSAHSLLYDIATNTYRPLQLQTNVWCSSGSLHPDGTLVQTGGYGDGEKKIRLFKPCNGVKECEWIQQPEDLTVKRWYSSNQILPDGRVIVVGGTKQFSYEFFPKSTVNALETRLYPFPFLNLTTDPFAEDNLYPFLHLLPDGNLYVFANQQSILLDYVNNRVLKQFPDIPGDRRNYPSTGSSVLLPLRGQNPEAEVLICGGAAKGSFYKAKKLKIFEEASKTCGRMKLTDPNPQWVMENMPTSRTMADLVLLPSGDVLIINGASNGTAAWECAVSPVFTPFLYSPTQPDLTRRFAVLNPGTKPRMYHSTAVLIADGRVLVGGSNPHDKYVFHTENFPTDLSLEAFYPPYLARQYTLLRPTNLTVDAKDNLITYGQQFSITFTIRRRLPDEEITLAMIAPAFATHSNQMNQRMVYLDIIGGVQRKSRTGYKANVLAPATKNIAPPGYYMLFPVHAGKPGESVWIRIDN